MTLEIPLVTLIIGVILKIYNMFCCKHQCRIQVIVVEGLSGFTVSDTCTCDERKWCKGHLLLFMKLFIQIKMDKGFSVNR